MEIKKVLRAIGASQKSPAVIIRIALLGDIFYFNPKFFSHD